MNTDQNSSRKGAEAESDTPRTDAAEFTDGHASTISPLVSSGLARQLERELASYKQAAFVVTDMDRSDPEDLIRWAEEMLKLRDELQRDLAAAIAERDAARLELAEATKQRDDGAKIFLDEMDAIHSALGCLDGKESLMDGILRLKKEHIRLDDLRECLREAVRHADSFPEAYPIEQVERWRKAAGLEKT